MLRSPLLYLSEVFAKIPISRSNFVTYLACPMLSIQSSIRAMGNVSVFGNRSYFTVVHTHAKCPIRFGTRIQGGLHSLWLGSIKSLSSKY